MPNSYRDYPDCPECETDVFVDGCSNLHDYRCHSCGRAFDAERTASDGRRPEWVIGR